MTPVLALFVSLGIVSPALAQAPGMTPVPQSGPPGAVPPNGSPTPPPPPRWQPPAGAPVYPYPPSATAPEGGYVAPLSQTTQPTYVPQSVALSGPRMIRDSGQGPIPYGYHRETRLRKGPIIAGAIVFGIPYLYSALIASVGSDVSDGGENRVAALYVPVLGPFIELSESNSATLDYLLVLDGLAQGAGAALFVYGLTSPQPVLIRNDLAMVTVTPAHFGKNGTGLMVMGRF